MPDSPKNLAEWQAYVATLSGPDLRSKAIAANSVAFVRSLEEDGLSPEDIAGVLRAFAARMHADGQEVPARSAGDFVDYGALVYPADLSVQAED